MPVCKLVTGLLALTVAGTAVACSSGSSGGSGGSTTLKIITWVNPPAVKAAWMEGSGYLSYLFRVVVPLTRPALLIAFLYGLLGVWNDIIGPVVLLADPSLFPVTRGIYNFFGSNESQWTLLAAAIVIASLPVAALFAASQRQINRASLVGAVKG